jgi:hypothetical protein
MCLHILLQGATERAVMCPHLLVHHSPLPYTAPLPYLFLGNAIGVGEGGGNIICKIVQKIRINLGPANKIMILLPGRIDWF